MKEWYHDQRSDSPFWSLYSHFLFNHVLDNFIPIYFISIQLVIINSIDILHILAGRRVLTPDKVKSSWPNNQLRTLFCWFHDYLWLFFSFFLFDCFLFLLLFLCLSYLRTLFCCLIIFIFIFNCFVFFLLLLEVRLIR